MFFLKFGSKFHSDFFCQVRDLYRAYLCENGMFGSHLFPQLRFKTVSTNQIARLFKLQYIKNGLTLLADFLYFIVKPSEEWDG